MDETEIVVLDEADRLLDLGFQAEIEEIMSLLPPAGSRQTLLLSATVTSAVESLAKTALHRAEHITTQSASASAVADPDSVWDVPKTLRQEFVRVKRNADREAIFLALCARRAGKKGADGASSRKQPQRAMVFFNRKKGAHRALLLCGLAGISAAELHGNLTMPQRLQSLDRFRSGEVNVLLCTDVAARGLDIPAVALVLNFDMPRDLKRYIHRIGRTARAGREGLAISLAGETGQQHASMRAVVKSAKGAGIKLFSRTVPAPLIKKWRETVEDLEESVVAILEDERQEKNLRLAEVS